MLDYRSAYVPGGIYFFTVNTYGRGAFLLDEPVRRALREGIRGARDELPFVIEALAAGPLALHLDAAAWRCGFFEALGDHQ